MAEYINRDEAIAIFGEETWAAAVLESIPSADVVEQRHGNWRLIGFDKRGRGGMYLCSACNKSYPYITDFCPNCGAKMEGYE